MSLNLLLAISGVLMLFCVFANRISDRYDIPALLLFLGLGMLAGNEGVGHIHFYNAKLSNYIGTVALIFILFSGGLETKWNEIKPVIFRGTLLSTLGVILTALILFLCSHYLLRLPIEVAMVLSTIVSSTDAPAVFNLMRSQQDSLKPGLKPLLEFESGSNDPMAVLLSMGAISLLSAPEFRVIDVLADFIIQMVLGLVMGLFIGRSAAYILGHMKLNYLGLYPVFGIGIALVSFGFTELLNGNGYLAVYLTGITLGNEVFLYRRHLIRESWKDRDDDDLHSGDTVEEKLSLVKRFGLTLYYPSPDQKEYLNIVRTLAEREGIKVDADLERDALIWQRREGGYSGRTAEQFLVSEKQKR